MRPYLKSLTQNITLTGDIKSDMVTFLQYHGFVETIAHVSSVAAEAKRLALKFGANPEQAQIAGWLHDISVIIPNEERVTAAHTLNVDLLPEEEAFPMIIHQKLSVVFARKIFGVTNPAILSAIGCHTTLKVDSSRLDQVVFVADKVAWDQPGQPPYLADILTAETESLRAMALCYLQYLWGRRDTLGVVHPWFVKALHQLEIKNEK